MIRWMLCQLERNPHRAFAESELRARSDEEFEAAKERRLVRHVQRSARYVLPHGESALLLDDREDVQAYDEEELEEGPVAVDRSDLARWRLDLDVLAADFRERNGLAGWHGRLTDRSFSLGARDETFVLALLCDDSCAARELLALPPRLTGARRVVAVCPSFLPSPDTTAVLRGAGVETLTLTGRDLLDLSMESESEGEEFSFVRTGEVWSIRYERRPLTLRHMKGLALIHYLLQHPFEDFSALDLIQALEPRTAAPPNGSGVPEGLRIADLGDAGEVIDDQARRELQTELNDLDRRIAAARDSGNAGQAEELEAQREEVRRYLSGATGRGGRVRRAGSARERARSNLTHRLKDALAKIEEADISFAVFLRNAVKRGDSFRYEPDRPIRWKL